MQKYWNTVTLRTGKAVEGASVAVTTYPAGSAAPLYSDNGVTPISNPVTTDASGYFEFYAADGRYSVTVTGAGITPYTINDVALLEDQADGFSSLSADDGADRVGYAAGESVQDALNARVQDIATYAALRAYSGALTSRYVTATGMQGRFDVDASDTTSADNGGTIIVGADGRRWKRDYIGPLSVLWFGVVGDGVTPDATAFGNAVAASAGKILDIGSGLSIYLESAVTVSAGIRIVGASTFIHPPASSAILVDYPLGASTSVSAIGAATNYPAFTGNIATPLTVASAAGFSRGDACLLHSEDTYAFTPTTQKAEVFRVLEVVGSTVYVHGLLQDTYSTNITLSKLSDDRFELDGPTFALNQDPFATTGSIHGGSVVVLGANRPRIKATFRDNVSTGLALFSCFLPDVDVSVRDLRDKQGINQLGYGVVASGATRFGAFNVRAERVRHAWTNGLFGTTADKRRTGAVRNNHVSGVAINCTSAAWDTHNGAFSTVFASCYAKWENQDADTVGSSTMYGFQDRGCDTEYINCHEVGIGYGWFLGAMTADHGKDNVTILRGVSSKNVSGVATAPGINMQGNTSGRSYTARVYSSDFNKNSFASFSAGAGTIEFFDTTFHDCVPFRFGQNNVATMLGCRRIDKTGATVEPFIVDIGSTLTIDDFYTDATAYGFGQIVRAGNSTNTGSVTINAGSITVKNPASNTVAIGTNGFATLTQNRLGLAPAPAKKGTTASRPALTASDVGVVYHDTTLVAAGKPIWWTGTAWVDATGAAA